MFDWDERDETIQIGQERVHVRKAIEIGCPNRAFERRSQVWSRVQQLDQVLDDRDMPSRLLRCLITGAGGQDDKREKDTQHGYPERVAQVYAQCSVPPPESPVRVFAPLRPQALVFGVQFISGVLVLANLFVRAAREWLPKSNAAAKRYTIDACKVACGG